MLLVGSFLMWAVALTARQLGRQDARHDADNIVRRVAVVVLSTEQLSIGPRLRSADRRPGYLKKSFQKGTVAFGFQLSESRS